MYPYLTQALAAERVRDQQQLAALARLARQARRARRRRLDVVEHGLAADCLAADDLAGQDLVHVDHDSRELAGVR